jgi:hypothetical protein
MPVSRMSWKGDSQATAPKGRKASTSVMPVLESVFRKRFVAFQHVLFSLRVEYSLSLNPFQVSLGLWFCSEYFVVLVPTTQWR